MKALADSGAWEDPIFEAAGLSRPPPHSRPKRAWLGALLAAVVGAAWASTVAAGAPKAPALPSAVAAPAAPAAQPAGGATCCGGGPAIVVGDGLMIQRKP